MAKGRMTAIGTKHIKGPASSVYKKYQNPKRMGQSMKHVSTQNIFQGVYINTNQRISKTLTTGIHRRKKSTKKVKGHVMKNNGNIDKIYFTFGVTCFFI